MSFTRFCHQPLSEHLWWLLFFFWVPGAQQAKKEDQPAGGAVLLRVDLAFGPTGEKKVKIFLSPVAGQVVDVGTSWAGGAALLRVDLAFAPIGEKKVKIFLSPDRGPTPSGSSTNSLYRAVLSSRPLPHIIRHFLTLGILFE